MPSAFGFILLKEGLKVHLVREAMFGRNTSDTTEIVCPDCQSLDILRPTYKESYHFFLNKENMSWKHEIYKVTCIDIT
jgi:hypothetical protein